MELVGEPNSPACDGQATVAFISNRMHRGVMAKYMPFFGVQAGQEFEAQPQGFDCFTRLVSKTCARSTTAGQRFSHLTHILWKFGVAVIRLTFSADSSRASA